MNRPGRSVRSLSIVAYAIAGLLAAAGIIVGLIPYTIDGYGAVCASALGRLTGAVTPLQSVAERFSGGLCVGYEGQMTALMFSLLGAAAIALVAGLMSGSWARRLRPVGPPPTGNLEAVAHPTHFPVSTEDQDEAFTTGDPRRRPSKEN